MQKKKVVILTGAGVSAESGIKTFRDSDGLWEGYDVMEVATPEAWERDPQLVQKFYNERRRGILAARPNQAHEALVRLEEKFEVHIITQNIDDLHERAGSSRVLHLHGQIMQSRSSVDDSLIYNVEGETIEMGERCEKGSQLRPHIVWFGEAVPMMDRAGQIAAQAEIFVVIGTSLVVYPAAGLVDFAPAAAPLFVVDPGEPALSLAARNRGDNFQFIQENASTGVPRLVEQMLGGAVL